ncbi:hypothetical protein HBH56_203210 [Parastagonospora nodorum]|nr:hypothetical protein HBH56_203210 [Parastagonospora nodorum]KAH3923971.1 hypothetical protein HBH54_202080 [Parastagonospora nodorum]KAH3941456.1 hypothetical protein HBH53_201970 [Parastagonospora nodorum]KAH3959556.1 hypothetical protein HBH51_198540 [Parastagonospora nodorum]KAH4010610.1 hypothetical protein HBI09_230930 [Parastagonospora nodorum]
MAPRKKTEEKASANEAADMVLHYLRKQNRPYSAIDVSANLHNKVTKAAAAKVLKDLHEQKQIEGRPAGKQIVYHAIQDPSDSCTPEQLSALDTLTTDLRNKTVHLTSTAKTLRSSLSSLNSSLSTVDLVSSVHALEAEKAEILARLQSLKEGRAKKVTKEQREEVEREWKRACAVAKRRERVCGEVWGYIEDQVPDKEARGELREGLGLDE